MFCVGVLSVEEEEPVLSVGDNLGFLTRVCFSTPLMEAAQEGHLELVKYLIKSRANVNAQTGTGDTALTYACENGHTDVADVLLQHGAELVSTHVLLLIAHVLVLNTRVLLLVHIYVCV